MARKTNTEITDEHRERLKRNGFKPGKSGNPKGRPLEDDALKSRIRQKLPALIDRLEFLALEGENESSSVKAIETMLSYILSKATTKHEHEIDVNLKGFGDFLIEANRRHEQTIGTKATEVIEGEFVAVEHKADL